MKTADLIPLILLELNECDKYGFELTKSIETKSKGKIIIKQPTLYTILKKLEKSKFISSYWLDSDIGGKRHYYKIKKKKKMQVSTLPHYDVLIKNIISEDNDDNSFSFYSNENNNEYSNFNNNSKDVYSSNSSNISIMDSLLSNEKNENLNFDNNNENNTDNIKLQENILPSQEVFANSNIDNATEMEINQSNTEILKNDKVNTEEKFAENKDVAKFTEKQSTIISEEYKNQFTTTNDNEQKLQNENVNNVIFNLDDNTTYVNEDSYKKIKFVDYVDFKTNPNYIYAKNTIKNLRNKILATSLYLFVMMLISTVIVNFKTNASALYYVFFLISLFVFIFYPSIFACLYEKFRQHLQNDKYEPDLKKQLYITLTIELFIIIICIVVNINMGNNNLQKMFSISNFANLYAPIILSTTMFADILFTYLFVKKNKK